MFLSVFFVYIYSAFIRTHQYFSTSYHFHLYASAVEWYPWSWSKWIYPRLQGEYQYYWSGSPIPASFLLCHTAKTWPKALYSSTPNLFVFLPVWSWISACRFYHSRGFLSEHFFSLSIIAFPQNDLASFPSSFLLISSNPCYALSLYRALILFTGTNAN